MVLFNTGSTRFTKGAYIHKADKVQKVGNATRKVNNRWRQRVSQYCIDLLHVFVVFFSPELRDYYVIFLYM